MDLNAFIYQLKNIKYKYIKKEISDTKSKILKINQGDEKTLLLNQLEEIEKEFYEK